MEAGALSGTSDSLDCPLREAVVNRYAQIAAQFAGEQPLEAGELLAYLRGIDRVELKPLQGVLLQTEAMGDPAMPTPEQAAILEWLGDAFDDWQQRYPLEQPLAGQLRQLLPLAGALAISEPVFLRPGEHPFHTLLDTIQEYAIGWQPSLGRAGHTLQKQVESAVKLARAWFDNPGIDLAAVCAEVSATAERDRSRARRMAQRVMEAEQGKLRATRARRDAAVMINTYLARFPAPESLQGFLQGPWYDSAQLVLLKFGTDSEQWRQMTETTETLLDSMQAEGPQGENRRQYLFEVVTRLPKELKHWLLSLQHDAEAINECVQPIEHAHLRILRQLDLGQKTLEPLPVEDLAEPTEEEVPPEIAALSVGQWFRVRYGEDPVARVQLALKLEDAQQLLFSNQAGVKSLQLDYLVFRQLLTEQRAVPLYSGASFSHCLANAAGIESEESLRDMTALAAERAALRAGQEQEARQRAEDERRALEQRRQEEQVAREKLARQEAAAAEAEKRAAEEAARERAETVANQLEADLAAAAPMEEAAVEDPALQAGSTLSSGPTLVREAEAQQPESAPADLAPGNTDASVSPVAPEVREIPAPPEQPTSSPPAATAPDETAPAATEMTLEQAARQLGGGEEAEDSDSAAPAVDLADAPELDLANLAPLDLEPPEPELPEPEPVDAQALAQQQAALLAQEQADRELEEERQRRQAQRWEERARDREAAERLAQQSAPAAAPAQAQETPAPVADAADPDPPPTPPARETSPVQPAAVEASLSMGSWLGFHDGEAPLMAKLAVHDPEQDSYIFVNRQGIKMRQISGAELQALIEEGLVDILETRSSFRAEVGEARMRDE